MSLIFNQDTGKYDFKVMNTIGEKFIFSIPSKIFPLDDNNDFKIFTEDTTKPIVMNQKLLKIIDSVPAEMGRCYTNTMRLCEEAKKQGVDIEFYAGWIITPNLLPTHHAWAVYSGNKVIDLSNEKNPREIFKEFFEKFDFEDKNFRKEMAKIYKDLYKKPNTKRCIIGKINEENIYIGSKSTPESAVTIFTEIAKNENHILHRLQTDGTNLKGMSKLQEEFYSLEE